MPAFFPILETLLKHALWYRQQHLFQFFFYLLNCTKTLSFHRRLQCREEENVSGGQVRWIRSVVEAWLWFLFRPKSHAQHRCVSRCVIMVQNPWLVFPEFCAFLSNCVEQSAHSFKVVFLIYRTTLWQRIHDAPRHCNRWKQWVKPSHLTELDVLFVGLGSSGRFHWNDWALVSMS